MECIIKDTFINYEIIGEGKPIIVLHGLTVDHRLMKGCVEPIFERTDGYKRIYIDLPGMGKTRTNRNMNSDMILDILIELIGKIIPDTSFLLAGESYGGYLSRGVIYKLGTKVDGLMLLCPAIITDFEKRTLPVHTILKKDDELLSQLDPSDADDFNSIQVVQSKKIWERYRDEILSGIRLADDKFCSNLRQNGYTFSFDVDDLIKSFDKPTLMLMGRQDSSVGYKDAWNILDKYPRATFAVLDMAGHNLQIEQPEVFESLVNEWLNRVSDI